jgi:hypothetical protein
MYPYIIKCIHINKYPYIQPDFNQDQFQTYRFLQSPPAVDIGSQNYSNKISVWNADVYLLATYCFLSKEEQALFASQDQVYLIKDVFEYDYLNITGANRVKLRSTSGMVASWMFFFQRADVNLRNEWSNYTNWAYESQLPSNIKLGPVKQDGYMSGPGANYVCVTGNMNPGNRRDILETFGIVIDGDYRENVMPRGIYDFVEKYTRTQGNAKDGLYCYNFCLNTSPFEYQPSGALNMSKFKNIELEFTTYLPQIDTTRSNFAVVCDANGNPVSVSEAPSWALYVYNYNLTVFEERYNVLSFIGGNCGLLYAR